MRRYLQVFLLAVAFDLYWALVVLFREQGLIIWLALAIWRACSCRLYTVFTPLGWPQRAVCWIRSGR